MFTCIIVFFTVFLKNRNIGSKIKRSKVTDYAALKLMGKKILAILSLKFLINWAYGYTYNVSRLKPGFETEQAGLGTDVAHIIPMDPIDPDKEKLKIVIISHMFWVLF